MKTPTLPPYAPKTPLKSGPSSNYNDNVRNYGPAPKGWRWRKIGETDADGDIIADGWGKGEWRIINGGSVVRDTYWPIATPVKVLVKRDSRGRFAPEVPAKTLPDLGERFRRRHGGYSKQACEDNIKDINAVLADPIKGYGRIWECFTWRDTTQGQEYWNFRAAHGSLSPEDLDYLRAAKEFFEKRIVELTPPTPTLPELQAKISSLETEVASLRRKIAGAKVTFPE